MIDRLRNMFGKRGAEQTDAQSTTENDMEMSERGNTMEEEPSAPVEIPADPEPRHDFEQPERQRHFGILQYAMTTRFRRMMIIGAINVSLFIACFLFIFLFVELHLTKETEPVTTLAPDTPTEKPVTNGWCYDGHYKHIHTKCWRLSGAGNHYDSERVCTSAGATLATIHSEAQHKWMVDFVGSNNGNSTWLGIYCTGNNVESCMWDDTEPMTNTSFHNFAKGHPNITIGLCVSYDPQDTHWYSTPCSTNVTKVCEMPITHGSNGKCKSINGDFCYHLGDPAPFYTAAKECQLRCSQLASVHSIEENQYIRTQFSLFNYPYYTLGGYAKAKDQIDWLDGSTTDFINMENFYGEGCVYMSYSLTNTTRGNWFTGPCTLISKYVCKKRLTDSCPTIPEANPLVVVTAAPPRLSACNKLFFEAGSFTSPNFPNPYPPYTNCTYMLTTYGPQRINLQFHQVLLGTDKVMVYDNDSDKDGFAFNLTGTQTIFYNSLGNVLYITFQTGNNNSQGFGFNATFTTIY